MQADSYFYIGKTHDVCEDYALSYNDKDVSIAIISDGCSSSNNTDIGARHLAIHARRNFTSRNFNEDVELFGTAAISDANYSIKDLGLDISAVDATLLCIEAREGRWRALCFGDGFLIKIRKDGKIEVTDIEYTSGAPLYLTYAVSAKRRQEYVSKFGLERKISKYIINTDIKDISIIPAGTITDTAGIPYSDNGTFDDYHTILVASDGIKSFQQKSESETSSNIESVPEAVILRQLLDFKGFNGEFVARRMKRFMKNNIANNLSNMDDLSVAAIHV